MLQKTRKAFTLAEMLIAMIVVGIVGAAASAGLWFAFNVFFQLDEYTAAEAQIEHAFRMLSREFTMIGLGMPNNDVGEGSFARTFQGSTPQPATAVFGPPAGTVAGPVWTWGGPVTVGGGGSTNTLATQPWAGAMPNIFVGPQLFYSWGVPTGVRVGINVAANPAATTNLNLELDVFPHVAAGGGTVAGVQALLDLGLQTTVGHATDGANLHTWLLLPTVRVPMRAMDFNINGMTSTLDVTVVPNESGNALGVSQAFMAGGEVTARALDEVHLIRAARLFLDGPSRELRRVFLNAPFNEVTLARNIVGLAFTFNPENRLLTMHIAAEGHDGGAVGRQAEPNWPAAEFGALLAGSAGRRIAVRNLSWRIRN